MYYGAIEAGGTKFVCAVSNEKFEIVKKASFPTEEPEKTLKNVFQFFDQFALQAIGIGSFGPIEINKKDSNYGYVTNTPKLKWKNFDFYGTIKRHYQIPVAWTTDVNAAAYGEFFYGNAKDIDSCIYLTVGTGIGGAAVVNGDIIGGFGHPEMGHIPVRLHPDDRYEGCCPYHGDCLEGLASGPAIENRYQKSGKELERNQAVWALEAFYLAQALAVYTLTLRPDRIILGGGVMNQTQLFDLTRSSFASQINQYVALPDLEEFIVSPGLDNNSAITGGLLLASELATTNR